ncbi:MAG: cytochrome b N-terminal domain-containing protein [Alphaproteobacteria bacterium]
MSILQALVRTPLAAIEGFLGKLFPPQWNPMLNLGALGFFFYWVITVSGIYLFVFFDTGIHKAFESIEAITYNQWYAGGVMRSLHRYASDGLIIVLLVHMLREFGLGRYRFARWFSWVTGVIAMVIIYLAGISGYWLVWDKLAQYVAIVTTEWLDWLPIFGESVARNFLAPDTLDSRFFTLMIFMHIALPLIGLGVLWVHLQRIRKPHINPPRGLAFGTFGSMLLLSLVYPAVSQGPADLAKVPGTVGLDWFYLPLFPLLETLPGTVTWIGGACLLLILATIPFLPPMRRPPPALVDLDNCNGCGRCDVDCPYHAIAMVTRNDGTPFSSMPSVNASLCVSCGICAGSCPTATPFRRHSNLLPGIDMPDFTIARLRDMVDEAARPLTGHGRLMVFRCEHAGSARRIDAPNVAAVSLRCVAQLPPSFIDYVLSRDLADGIVLAGCSENSCYNRFGIQWTEARLDRSRDPQLRRRVDRRRVKTMWWGESSGSALGQELQRFSATVSSLGEPTSPAMGHRPGLTEGVTGSAPDA